MQARSYSDKPSCELVPSGDDPTKAEFGRAVQTGARFACAGRDESGEQRSDHEDHFRGTEGWRRGWGWSGRHQRLDSGLAAPVHCRQPELLRHQQRWSCRHNRPHPNLATPIHVGCICQSRAVIYKLIFLSFPFVLTSRPAYGRPGPSQTGTLSDPCRDENHQGSASGKLLTGPLGWRARILRQAATSKGWGGRRCVR